jgi:hypothetical protein
MGGGSWTLEATSNALERQRREGWSDVDKQSRATQSALGDATGEGRGTIANLRLSE